jgi:hypothetical protein
MKPSNCRAEPLVRAQCLPSPGREQPALVAPQVAHAAPSHRRLAPQPSPHRRRLRQLMRSATERTSHIARDQGPEAGVAPQAPSRTGRLQMRPSRLSGAAGLSCRRPQDADRPVSLIRTMGTACGHPRQSQDTEPSFLRTLGVDCGHPRGGHCLLAPLRACVRSTPHRLSAFAQAWRRCHHVRRPMSSDAARAAHIALEARAGV